MNCPICDTDLDQFDNYRYDYMVIECPDCLNQIYIDVDYLFDESIGDEYPVRKAEINTK